MDPGLVLFVKCEMGFMADWASQVLNRTFGIKLLLNSQYVFIIILPPAILSSHPDQKPSQPETVIRCKVPPE